MSSQGGRAWQVPPRSPFSWAKCMGSRSPPGHVELLGFRSNPQQGSLAQSPQNLPEQSQVEQKPSGKWQRRQEQGKCRNSVGYRAQIWGESWLCFSLAVWPEGRYLTSLSLTLCISQRTITDIRLLGRSNIISDGL